MFFTKDTLHESFISKKKKEKKNGLKIAQAFTTCLLVFTENEMCNISNKYQPVINVAKYQYFYTRDFISFIHFDKKLTLSIANVFRNIHFLPHFHYF